MGKTVISANVVKKLEFLDRLKKSGIRWADEFCEDALPKVVEPVLTPVVVSDKTEPPKDVKIEAPTVVKVSPINYLAKIPLNKHRQPVNLCNKDKCPAYDCCLKNAVKGEIICDFWHKMPKGYARVDSKFIYENKKK